MPPRIGTITGALNLPAMLPSRRFRMTSAPFTVVKTARSNRTVALGQLRDIARQLQSRDDHKQHADGDVRRAAALMDLAQRRRQQALPGHAIEQARAHDVIDQSRVGHRGDGDEGET